MRSKAARMSRAEWGVMSSAATRFENGSQTVSPRSPKQNGCVERCRRTRRKEL